MGKKSELDDLRARLATLEAEVDRLRGAAGATGATAATDVDRAERRTEVPAAEVRSAAAPQDHAPVPSAVRRERARERAGEQPQSMTGIADAIGVMVSGRPEQSTRVLRAHSEAPERQTPDRQTPERQTPDRQSPERKAGPPRPAHGEFLEGLLSGRPALPQ
ncbi:hypothetical protein AB0O91_07120 [Kitasatospora sp. NPDC089797]|uniref:hypothetical protein n=1 Tax=Kitasatospora sp. NPDC089797 TaxID=3155298 RepID=UPI003449E7C4